MILAGIDLAWKGERHPSAVAMGELKGAGLTLLGLAPALIGMENLIRYLDGFACLQGVAVDASLIINNLTGQRPCETELSRVYSSKGAACHATNLSLYPDPFSVRFSWELGRRGFVHLGSKKWQIECYPHPSIIELFGLPKRLKYKKGSVREKRQGQCLLAGYIHGLAASTPALVIPDPFTRHFDPAHIETLKGKALKTNEDAMDAVICLYVAALYASRAPHRLFGDTDTGYIWVPRGV